MWTGIWQQTKSHQSIAIRWLQDTHTHTHTHTHTQSHLVAADNKSVSAPFLIPISTWFKGGKASQATQTIYITFSPDSCVQRGVGVFLTQPSGHLQAPRLRSQNCDSTTNSSHGEYIFCCCRGTNTTSGTSLVLKSNRRFLNRAALRVRFVFDRFQQVKLKNLWPLNICGGVTNMALVMAESGNTRLKQLTYIFISRQDIMWAVQTTDTSRVDICAKRGISRSHYMLISGLSHWEVEGTEAFLQPARLENDNQSSSHTAGYS